jgi:uncharacterized membrane protein YdjX (TVP38/TMEM64 family)
LRRKKGPYDEIRRTIWAWPFQALHKGYERQGQGVAENRQKLEEQGQAGWVWRYLPLAVVLAGAAAVFATGLHRSLNFETFVDYQMRLREMVEAHWLQMLGLYVLVYVAAVTLSLPASAFLTTIGGYLFGWAIGGTVASMAATLGATSIFLIAKTSLGQTMLRRAGSRIQNFAEGFKSNAFSYLLFLRLMPVVPFWVTNLAAAFFGLRLKTFVLATQIGMIPASFAFAFAGSGLDEIIAAQQHAKAQCLSSGGQDCALELSVKNLLTPRLMTALVILGILALAPILVRHWQGRRKRILREENL